MRHLRHATTLLGVTMSIALACSKKKMPTRRVYPADTKITIHMMPDFFRKLKLNYTKTLVFSSGCEQLSKCKKEDYSKYKADQSHYDELISRYAAQAKACYVAPGYIKWVSDKVGYGFYCDEDRAAGDFIGEYSGEVLRNTTKDSSTFTWTYPPGGSFLDELGQHKYKVSGQKYRNEMSFVNHSDDNNVEMKFIYAGGAWHVTYVAKRAIKKGEQFTASYGASYWDKREKVDQ